MIFIESKRKKLENILNKCPSALIVDVTSKAIEGLTAKVAIEVLQEGASPLTFSYWQLKPYII